MCMCSLFTSIIHHQTLLRSFNVVVRVPVVVVELGAVAPHPNRVLQTDKHRNICKLVTFYMCITCFMGCFSMYFGLYAQDLTF